MCIYQCLLAKIGKSCVPTSRAGMVTHFNPCHHSKEQDTIRETLSQLSQKVTELCSMNLTLEKQLKGTCISKALIVKTRVELWTIEIIRTGFWECISTCLHMVKWVSLSGWLMVQTDSYSKLLTGLNFMDLLPICLNFVDLIYTPRNLIRLQ